MDIENVFQFQCDSALDALKYFWKGLKNKMMSSHKLNATSSRSHCIFTILVTQEDFYNENNLITSKLQLVDLAGSER